MALFNTPEEIAFAERQVQNQATSPLGLFAGLGKSVGDAGIRFAGGDTRSDALKKSQQLQTLMKGTDFRDAASVQNTVNTLNDAGFTNEAFKVLEAVPASAKPQKHVVDEWFQVTNQGDTTRKSLWQRDNLGFVSEVGAVTDTATLGQFKGFSPAWEKDIKFDQDSRGTFLGRLKQQPEFKSLIDDTDEDQLGQFSGLIQKVANDMKDDHRNKIRAALDGGKITAQQANAFSPSSDDFYLDEAYQRFVKAGGVEANIDRGFDLAGGADVALAPNTNTTDPAALTARIEQGEKKAKAISDVAARTGTLVRGDPNTGQFTIGALAPGQAAAVFNRMDGPEGSDEAIQQKLTNLGFQFTPEMVESHAKVWQVMRENPQVTAKFINLSDSPREFKDEAGDLLDQLEDADNFPAFATAASILKYVGRINQGNTSAKKKQAATVQEIQESVSGP